MRCWKFVDWEVLDFEKVKLARCPQAILAYENGDKDAIKRYYDLYATIETLTNPVVRIQGYAFSLQEYCKVYWVKTKYNGILEMYAPGKMQIRNILGSHEIIKIIQVSEDDDS